MSGIEWGSRNLDVQTAKENWSNFNESIKIALEDWRIDASELLALQEQYRQERQNTIHITQENLLSLWQALEVENPTSLWNVFNSLLRFRWEFSDSVLTWNDTISTTDQSREAVELEAPIDALQERLNSIIWDKYLITVDWQYFFVSEWVNSLSENSKRDIINSNINNWTIFSLEQVLQIVEETPWVNLWFRDLEWRALISRDNPVTLTQEQKLGIITSVLWGNFENTYENHLSDLSSYMPELPSIESSYDIYNEENFNQSILDWMNEVLSVNRLSFNQDTWLINSSTRVDDFILDYLSSFNLTDSSISYKIENNRFVSIWVNYQDVNPAWEITIGENWLITWYNIDSTDDLKFYKLKQWGEEVLISWSSLKDYMSQFESATQRIIQEAERDFEVNHLDLFLERWDISSDILQDGRFRVTLSEDWNSLSINVYNANLAPSNEFNISSWGVINYRWSSFNLWNNVKDNVNTFTDFIHQLSNARSKISNDLMEADTNNPTERNPKNDQARAQINDITDAINAFFENSEISNASFQALRDDLALAVDWGWREVLLYREEQNVSFTEWQRQEVLRNAERQQIERAREIQRELNNIEFSAAEIFWINLTNNESFTTAQREFLDTLTSRNNSPATTLKIIKSNVDFNDTAPNISFQLSWSRFSRNNIDINLWHNTLGLFNENDSINRDVLLSKIRRNVNNMIDS